MRPLSRDLFRTFGLTLSLSALRRSKYRAGGWGAHGNRQSLPVRATRLVNLAQLQSCSLKRSNLRRTTPDSRVTRPSRSTAIRSFDFGFESSTPKGFSTSGDGFEVALDRGVAQSGAQSLRLRRLSALPEPADDAPVLACESLAKCSDVLSYLEQNRDRYVQSGSSVADVEWAIQNARLVLQFVEMKAGTRTRDESMADNVDWIVKQNPDAKIMLWAHNSHVSNTVFSGKRSMGSCLRQMYGARLINLGFAFNQGSFRADEPGEALHEFTVPPAPEGTLDHALAATAIPLFAVDLRSVPENSPAAKWFAEPHKSRNIGAAFSDSLEPFLWRPGPVKSDFDVLLFVEKTSAARGNP